MKKINYRHKNYHEKNHSLKENKIEQGYIISRMDMNGRTEYLECVYKDYSESRRDAKKIVGKINKKIMLLNVCEPEMQYPYMREIAPDVWVGDSKKIMIEPTVVKEILRKRTIKTKFLNERAVYNLNSEIMLAEPE